MKIAIAGLGTEKICTNPDCKGQEDFCEDCAPRLLNGQGLCGTCLNDDGWDCDDCGASFLEARVTRCKNTECDKGYCEECKGGQLDVEGYCPDCPPSQE